MGLGSTMFDLFKTPERKPLWPHQEKALASIRKSILAGNKRILLCAPTASGKTRLSSEIILGAVGKGNRATFCAPMVTLIDQTIKVFENEGITDIGAMQADHPRTRPGAMVQVASVQTLARRQRPPSSVVLVDEAHWYSQAVVDWMQDEPDLIFIGLTATPGRVGMRDEWQDLIVVTTTEELIKAGVLSKFAVYAPSTADLSGVKIVKGDYETKGAEAAMSDKGLVGDILRNYIENGEGRPTLGFSVSVPHAHRMAEEFNEAGIPSVAVDASTDRLERDGIKAQFERGDIRVIWSVRTMTTGVDLPVSGIIDAAPTQSPMLHQQKIGRGLRVKDGTEDCVIWDHAGNTLRLGFVTDLDWSELPGGTRGDEEAKRKEPLPRECRACHSLMPPKVKVCPNCGEERKTPSGFIETEEGELIAITPEPEKRKFTMAEKQLWWSGLLKIGRERGYKEGWSANKYREKFGVWPRGLTDIASEPTQEMRSWVKSRQIAFAKAREKANG